ncbi:MAG: hypothetical protein JJE13_00715 [Thermoleophilia bacterium]|nr:hypothetical protein [Thermoleophilia bacterium]
MSVEIELMPDPVRHGLATAGAMRCTQTAVITVDEEIFEQIWTPSTLELLARSYWRFMRRRSLGLIRVSYRPDSQNVVLVSSRIPLLRFRSPEFQTGTDEASVTWPIEKGLLVAPAGRDKGFLRIAVRHAGECEDRPGRQRLEVTSDISNFYPWIRGSGWFARLGTWIYSQTQLRTHIWVTRGFLRSLEGLPDEVLKQGEDPETEPLNG